MRYYLCSLLCLLGVTVPVFTADVASAQAAEGTVMTDEHVERIRQNCTTAQVSLDRLRQNNDRPLRVNRGQIYEYMINGLMVPLNNRMALGDYDIVSQASTTSTMRDSFAKFDAAFKEYHDSILTTVAMNCKDRPVAFYDAVVTMRAKREAVRAAVQTVNQNALTYQAGVTAFATQVGAGR